MRYKYVPYRYTEYQYVLLCHNTPSFSEDGSPYLLMSYTRELYSHVIMQRDVGRTCKIGYTEICGGSSTKNHWEKSRRRCDSLGKNFRGKSSPYVLVMVLLSQWLRRSSCSLQFDDEVRSLCWRWRNRNRSVQRIRTWCTCSRHHQYNLRHCILDLWLMTTAMLLSVLFKYLLTK